MKNIAISFALLISSQSVFAKMVETVIFINLNNSFDEERAAKTGVKKSKREFLSFPIAPQNILDQISELDLKIQTQLEIIGFDDCRGKLQQCERERELLNAYRENKKYLESPYKVDKQNLLAFFRLHKDKTFTSIIISGSHGTGTFTGRNGKLTDSDLAEVVASVGNMRETLTSLHLMGCYSTSPSSLLNNWITHFPQIKLVTGYSQKAPRHDRPLGWSYLSEVLEKESSLLQSCDPKGLQDKLRKIKAARSMHTAIYACGAYAEVKESYFLSAPEAMCDSLNKKFNEYLPDYQCYLSAEKKICENPPKDETNSKLRAFYEVLQKISICKNLQIESFDYSRDQAVRLLFFDNVKKNFSVYYSDLLQNIDEQLIHVGAPDRIRFTAIESLSRHEILERLVLLSDFLRDAKLIMVQSGEPSPFQKVLNNLDIKQSKLKLILDDLDPKCVPFSWIEPNEYISSPCLELIKDM